LFAELAAAAPEQRQLRHPGVVTETAAETSTAAPAAGPDAAAAPAAAKEEQALQVFCARRFAGRPLHSDLAAWSSTAIAIR